MGQGFGDSAEPRADVIRTDRAAVAPVIALPAVGALLHWPAAPRRWYEVAWAARFPAVARWFSPARASAIGELAERLPRLSVALAAGWPAPPYAHAPER